MCMTFIVKPPNGLEYVYHRMCMFNSQHISAQYFTYFNKCTREYGILYIWTLK